MLSFAIVVICTSLLTLSPATVSGQLAEQRQFHEGSDLTIVCNADTVGLSTSFTLIKSTWLEFVHDSDTKEEMAYIQQKDGSSAAISRRGFPLNGWTFTTPSVEDLGAELSSLVNNRDIMTITAHKTNAQCWDSGSFVCVVEYVSLSTEPHILELRFNYTAIENVSIQPMTGLPAGEHIVPETSLTLRCSAIGPHDFEFQWEKRCPTASTVTPSFMPWPDTSNIQEHVVSSRDETYCSTYTHTQEVYFQAQLEDNHCEIRCQFGSFQNGFIAHASSSTTLLIEEQESGNPVEEIFLWEGSDLRLTCNAYIVGISYSYRQIQSATLSHVEDSSVEEMAVVQQRDGSSQAISTVRYGFSDWAFTMPHLQDLQTELGHVVSNRNTVTIGATKANAESSDSGIYRCRVGYLDQNAVTVYKEKYFIYTVSDVYLPIAGGSQVPGHKSDMLLLIIFGTITSFCFLTIAV